MHPARRKKIYLTGAQMFWQAVWFFLHSFSSLLAWAALMGGITLMHPESVPALTTFTLSLFFPMLAGFVLVKIRASEVASLTWLAGIVWFMIVGLWILDMPTGTGACFHCPPGDKLWYSLFSMNADNGLLDGQGRFLGTWPAAAMIGYSLGAKLAMRGRQLQIEQSA